MARGIKDLSDLIKPNEAVEEEADVSKVEKLSPFDFIKSVSNNKNDLMGDGDPDTEKQYNAFIVNRGLGYFLDTVLYANEMNQYPDIPAKAQYYYYLSAIRKGNRFSKWHKFEKNEDQELVQMVYNVRPEVARMYLKNLSASDLEKLRELTSTGDEKPKKKKK